MNSALEQKLIECLDALERGQSVEQLLARYPDDATALRPMLEAARQLGQLKAAPSTAAQNASRRAFLAQAAALQSAAGPSMWAGELWRRFLRGLAPAMGVAAVLLMGVLLLANTAIPGEPFYGVKLQLEDWRLSLARDPQTIEALTEEWEARRLAEVQQLLAAGLQADVVFGDYVAGIASDHWTLSSGIRLNITDQTVIIGEPQTDVYLHIEGRTTDGAVTATLLHVGQHHSDLLNATPIPTEPPDQVIIPTATPTLSPSPTATLTPTATPSATSTLTPTATPTVTATVSPTATPDDDDDEDDDDDKSDSGSGDDDDDDNDDNSGSGSGDDDDDDGDDKSGSRSGDNDDDDDDDKSGSGNGDDDDDDDDDDKSGSGSGDDD